MNFFSSRPSTSNSSFGYKVNSIDGIPSDLEKVKGNILKTNKVYREELTKYREIAAFNEQLSKGYVRNLEAMVDVSRILNYYIDIFNVIREEFEKNDKVLDGTSLTPTQISYLERLTKSKIDELNNKFMVETEKLKKLYNQYGQQQELARIVEAQNNLNATTQSADTTLTRINQHIAAQQQQRGGQAQKKKAVKKTVVKKVTSKPKKSTTSKK